MKNEYDHRQSMQYTNQHPHHQQQSQQPIHRQRSNSPKSTRKVIATNFDFLPIAYQSLQGAHAALSVENQQLKSKLNIQSAEIHTLYKEKLKDYESKLATLRTDNANLEEENRQ